MFFSIARWLDQKQFLNNRLWEFSLGNLAHLFPYYYFFRVLLLHPKKALRGSLKYHRLVSLSKDKALYGTQKLENIFNELTSHHFDSRRFVLAPGFCMKPFDNDEGTSLCPVGHFNHRCWILEKAEWCRTEQASWEKPCRQCSLGALAQLAFKLRTNFYIMTSALDIALDLFLPAIKGAGAQAGIFFLCPYSAEAFTWGLATAGMDGALITFSNGDCLNREDFAQADIGIKQKQTFIDGKIFADLKGNLEKIIETKNAVRYDQNHFIFKNNVYQIRI